MFIKCFEPLSTLQGKSGNLSNKDRFRGTQVTQVTTKDVFQLMSLAQSDQG